MQANCLLQGVRSQITAFTPFMAAAVNQVEEVKSLLRHFDTRICKLEPRPQPQSNVDACIASGIAIGLALCHFNILSWHTTAAFDK